MQIAHCQPKLAPLSWQEHLQHGHVPFRRDCLVYQQSLQQEPPHRKVKHPLGGVLSVDTAGPFVRAYDAGGYKTAYILVGVLTWTVPKNSPLKEDDVEELEVEAPNFDANKGEEQDQLQTEDEPAGHEPVQGIFDDPEDESEEPEVQRAPEGEVERKKEKVEEKKEGEEEEKSAEFETRVFRLAAPMYSKKAKETTMVTMDVLLRQRADGFHSGHIHSDQGHEFQGQFKVWCRERGIHLTRTPGDDPRSTGRAECAVKTIKTQIRRVLLQAVATGSWWPWATRFVNELNRAARIGKRPDWPPFLSTAMIRKRKWRRRMSNICVRHLKTMVIGFYLMVNVLVSLSSS